MKLSLLAALLMLTLFALPVRAESEIDVRTREIAKDLRCPICQNLSVADSDTDLAVEMRSIIRTKLEQGESEEQIRQYFVQRYGEEVLLEPSNRGFTSLIWWQPVLLLMLGLVLVGAALTRWTRAKPQPDELPEPDEADLQEYESVIRDEMQRQYR